MKKFLCAVLIFLITSIPAYASDLLKTRALINTEFNLENVPKIVELITFEPVEINEISIPAGATIKAELYQYQKELRWHKSAFFICKPIKYILDDKTEIDIKDEDIYLIARKYKKVDGKDAAITSTELIAGATASIFLPGIDILYFFTKGALLKEKHKNWFRAGISNAYDNSICWFWLKGRDINLTAGDSVNIKQIKKKKAEKWNKKITKRRTKETIKQEKKELEVKAKLAKKQQKEERRQLMERQKLEREIAKRRAKSIKEAAAIETDTEHAGNEN